MGKRFKGTQGVSMCGTIEYIHRKKKNTVKAVSFVLTLSMVHKCFAVSIKNFLTYSKQNVENVIQHNYNSIQS